MSNPRSLFASAPRRSLPTGLLALLASATPALAAPPSFDTPQAFTSMVATWGSNPSAVSVADIDADGCRDVLAMNANTGTSGFSVSVLLGVRASGACTGALGAPTRVQVAAAPMDAALADVDVDGCTDIVVTTNADLHRFLQVKSGTTCTATFGSTSTQSLLAGRGLSVRDLDGDGCIDAAVGNWQNWSSPSYVSVLRGQKTAGVCTGTFLARTDVSSGPGTTARGSQNLTTGDMNADGCPDIVSANRRAVDTYSVIAQTKTSGACTGSFSTGVPYMGTAGMGAQGVTIGDFNSDGFADIAGTTTEGDPCPVVVMLGANGVNGSVGTLRAGVNATNYATITNSNPERIRNADLNGDGFHDLVASHFSSGSISVRPGNGDGTFGSRVDLATGVAGATAPALALADMNGDGQQDIVTAAAASGAGSVVVFLNAYRPPSPPTGGSGGESPASAPAQATEAAKTSAAEAAVGIVRPARRLNAVSVAQGRYRGKLRTVMRDSFQLSQPGRYTLIYVGPDGRRATVRTDTLIGSRAIRRPMSAPVIHVTDVSKPLRLTAVLSRASVRTGLTLRLILKQADGTLAGTDVPAVG